MAIFRIIFGVFLCLVFLRDIHAISLESALVVCSGHMQRFPSEKRSVQELILKHREELRLHSANAPRELKLELKGGPKDKDLYNSPGEVEVLYRGKPEVFFLGREESSSSETDMRVAFYAKSPDGGFHYLNGEKGIPNLSLQDPFVSKLKTEHGIELILGGVKIWSELKNGHEDIHYRTIFYRDYGKGIEYLAPFLEGPAKMKDIRVAQTKDDKRITVFTRPQSAEEKSGGRGKVGMFHVSRLEEITEAKVSSAPLFMDQFADSEWGGVNAAFYLDEKNIGVIGHYARFDDKGNRDYVAVSWIVDTVSGLMSSPKLVLERADLPNGIERGSKRADLKNVIFLSGFRINSDLTITAWGGEGDKLTFQVLLPNPF
jgi:hypothetical protein